MLGSSHAASSEASASDADIERQAVPEELSEFTQRVIVDEVLKSKGSYQQGRSYIIQSPLGKDGEPFPFEVICTKNLLADTGGLFVLGKQIGAGGQGAVHLAFNLTSKKWVAVKSYNPMFARAEILQEQKILHTLNRLVGTASRNSEELLTLMEYVRGYSLLDLLYEKNLNLPEEDINYFTAKKPIPLLKRAELVIQAIAQVIHFQELGIAHRDIKSENFVAEIRLNTALNPLVLIDVASAYFYMGEGAKLDKTNWGSKGYTAPEMGLPSSERPFVTGKTDLFSLAIVLAEILTTINYQKALRLKLEFIKETERFARDLTLDEYKACMRDVFNADFITPDHYNEPITENSQCLLRFLLETVYLLADQDPSRRPDLERLKEIQRELQRLYTLYSIEHKYLGDSRLGPDLSRRRARGVTLSALPLPESRSSGHTTIPMSPRSREKSSGVDETEIEAGYSSSTAISPLRIDLSGLRHSGASTSRGAKKDKDLSGVRPQSARELSSSSGGHRLRSRSSKGKGGVESSPKLKRHDTVSDLAKMFDSMSVVEGGEARLPISVAAVSTDTVPKKKEEKGSKGVFYQLRRHRSSTSPPTQISAPSTVPPLPLAALAASMGSDEDGASTSSSSGERRRKKSTKRKKSGRNKH